MSTYGDTLLMSSYVDFSEVSPYGDIVIVRSPKDMGARLRARRRELGLSQSAAAERAGVSRQWVVAAEGGKPSLELAAVLRIVAALDLALDLRPAPPAHRSIDLDEHLADFVD